jgi:hypothetical protein
MGPWRTRIFEKRIIAKKSLSFLPPVGFNGWDQPKEVRPPSQDSEERVAVPARIGEGIKVVGQMKPEFPGLFAQFREGPGLLAGFTAAFFAVIDSVTKIGTIILKRMEKASHTFIFSVQVPEGPATEPGDGGNRGVPLPETKGVFPEDAFYDFFVLDMFVPARTYGRAAGKTGFEPVRGAKSRIWISHDWKCL